MNLIMVWAWMLWSPDAIEHERYYGLGVDAPSDFGMDALVIGRRRT